MRAARGEPPSVETRSGHAGHLRSRDRGVVRAERGHHRRVQLPGRRSQDVLLITPDFRSRTRGRRSTTSGPVRGREELMVGDVLVNTHSGDRASPQPLVFPRRAQCRICCRTFSRACSRSRCSCSRSRNISGNGCRSRRSLGVVADARLRVAVHLERRRRPRRQPVLPAVLRTVSRPRSRRRPASAPRSPRSSWRAVHGAARA